MHIVLKISTIKLACTIYYATWNQSDKLGLGLDKYTHLVPDGYTCLASFVGCFAHMIRGAYYIHKSGILNPWLSDFIFLFADQMKAVHRKFPGRLFSCRLIPITYSICINFHIVMQKGI